MKIDRKTSDPIRISKAALSVVGMIQPGALEAALVENDYASGLVARVLWACPPAPMKQWSRARGGLSPIVEDAYRAMIARLFTLDMDTDDETGEPMPRALGMDADAEKVWGEHYDAINRRMAGESDTIRAMLSKLEGGAARLALVIHLGRWASGENVSPDTVNVESVRRGVELAEWFAYEAERLYDSLAGKGDDPETARLVERIKARGGSASVRELQRSSRDYHRADDARAALEGLVEAGLGNWSYGPTPDAGGRQGEIFILKNADPVDVDNRPDPSL